MVNVSYKDKQIYVCICKC